MANEEHTDIIYNPLDYSETCTLYFYNGRAEKGEIYHYDRTCGHVQFIIFFSFKTPCFRAEM